VSAIPTWRITLPETDAQLVARYRRERDEARRLVAELREELARMRAEQQSKGVTEAK
jgi:hypothetical protein